MFELSYIDDLRRFLREDLGVEGDVSTKFLGFDQKMARADFVAREEGVVAGLFVLKPLFSLLDGGVRLDNLVEEGSLCRPKQILASLYGRADALMAGERTALNLLSRCFGIATTVRSLVERLEGLPTQILPTRKTMPGLRFFDKYSCEVAGAARHRYGLNDAIMLKDNHLQADQDLETLLARLRGRCGHMLVVEMECDRLEQLERMLAADLRFRQLHPRQRGLDVVLLDNMSSQELRQAVALIKDHPHLVICEASGGIKPENVREVASTGVDYLSLGSLTHTVKSIDIGLDFAADNT